jgi:hypothetical protein
MPIEKKVVGKKEEKFDLSKIVCALTSLLIVIQAFQPLTQYIGWNIVAIAAVFIIIGIVTIVISALATTSSGGAAAFFGIGSLFKLGIMLIILGIIILLIAFSSSPELLKTVRIVWVLISAKFQFLPKISGTFVSYFALCATIAIATIASFYLKSPFCYILPFILWVVLFLGVKPALAIAGITKYTTIEKSVNVQYTVPYKTIPVSGGVSIEYGTKETNYLPATLLGGEPYIYYYSLQNLYEEKEKFKLDPFIEVRYQYATVRFKAPQKSGAPYTEPLTLENKSFYQDQIYYDPKTMKIETDNICYYTIAQMKSYYGKEFEPTCSFDKPACGEKAVCAKVADFMCDCLGWTGLTCGGYKAYMGMDVWHTGFLRATGTLFYKKEFFEPIANKRTTQGPFAITPIFFPNPWIETLYHPETGKTEYFTNVKLGVELENAGGGEIKIKSISATPINTEINTTVKGYSEELNDILEVTVRETIGINLIGCDDSEIKDKTLSSNVRIYREFCTFTKPTLSVSIIDLKAGKVRISQEIKTEDVYSYCKEGLTKKLENEKEKELVSKMMKLVGKTGLCEILSTKSEKGETKAETFAQVWKEKIENSLKSVDVILEVSYEREFTSSSKTINIFTSTNECLTYSCCHGGKNLLCSNGWEKNSKEWNENKCAEIF